MAETQTQKQNTPPEENPHFQVELQQLQAAEERQENLLDMLLSCEHENGGAVSQAHIITFLSQNQDVNPSRLLTTGELKGVAPIYIAAEKGLLELVKYFIEQKAVDPNQANGECVEEDETGLTPLFAAARADQLEVVKYLVQTKNVNPYDVIKKGYNFGETPYRAAVDAVAKKVLAYLKKRSESKRKMSMAFLSTSPEQINNEGSTSSKRPRFR